MKWKLIIDKLIIDIGTNKQIKFAISINLRFMYKKLDIMISFFGLYKAWYCIISNVNTFCYKDKS